MKTRIILVLGVALTLFGVILGLQQGFVYAAQQTVIINKIVADPPLSDNSFISKGLSGRPNRIIIRNLNIDIEVVDGRYNPHSQTWNLSEIQAQYATITPPANTEGGNTFIYGHNRPVVFKRLLEAQPGEIATVYTDNGHVFTYKLRSSRVTKPTDDSLFYYKGKPILTLQTCSGAWFQNRSLYTFDLIGAQ